MINSIREDWNVKKTGQKDKNQKVEIQTF
jgi:hypothetical protein